MERGRTNPSKLEVFGHSLLNKLPATARRRRKRQASKRRRDLLRREDAHDD